MTKAKVGDWLVMKGLTLDQHEQRGPLTEVHSTDGSPPYVVHDNDQVATVFPGPDALIVTAAEPRAADERAKRRIATVQAGIELHSRSK